MLASDAGYLMCNLCQGGYHYECLNFSLQQFMALTHEFKTGWKCPPCCNITRRTRPNLDTPVRSSTQVPAYVDNSMNMSCDNMEQRPGSPRTPPCMYTSLSARVDSDSTSVLIDKQIQSFTLELNKTLQGWRSDIDRTMALFKEDIKGTLKDWRDEMEASMLGYHESVKNSLADMKQELGSVCAAQTDLKKDVKEMNDDISSLKHSLQFYASEQIDLRGRVEDIARLQVEQSATSTSYLESKIEALEQQARQCNLEICNVPDKRGENLLQVLGAIGDAIGFPIPQKDIIAIHRVPHAHQQTNRPKNIIVKFSTRILRDNVHSAFRQARSLKTDQIGITGSSTNIYINDHLTLKNKMLFRKCKEAAKLHQYNYVWIKNCTILVRKKDGEAAFAIRSESDIAKINSDCNTIVNKTNIQ